MFCLQFQHIQCMCMFVRTCYICISSIDVSNYIDLRPYQVSKISVFWHRVILVPNRFHAAASTLVVQRGTYFLDSHDQSGEEGKGGVDVEMARLSSQLDGWCLDLKRNVLVCHLFYMYVCMYEECRK